MDRYDAKVLFVDTGIHVVEMKQSIVGWYVLYEDYKRAISWLKSAAIDSADNWVEKEVAHLVDTINHIPCGTAVRKAFEKALEEC